MVGDDGAAQYKLCKKYGSIAPNVEPITNLYLTEAEYNALAGLPGRDLVKHRYCYPFGDQVFSIDEFTDALAGLYLCEIEAATAEELAAILFPPFCTDDVTHDADYSGASLATW